MGSVTLQEKSLVVTLGEAGRNSHRHGWLVGGRGRALGVRSSMPTEGQGSAGVRPEQPSASVTAGDRVSRGARSFSASAGCCQAINSGGLGRRPQVHIFRQRLPNRSAVLASGRCCANSFALALVVSLAKRSNLTRRSWRIPCNDSPERYQLTETQRFRIGPTSPNEWYRQGPLLTLRGIRLFIS
jgi:hypothetical protein